MKLAQLVQLDNEIAATQIVQISFAAGSPYSLVKAEFSKVKIVGISNDTGLVRIQDVDGDFCFCDVADIVNIVVLVSNKKKA